MGKNFFAILLLLAVLVGCQISSHAQTPTPTTATDDADTIRINTEAVYFDLGVRDKAGSPLVQLNAADFSLYEDGHAQQIAHFTKVNTPIHLVMVLDASSSVSEHKEMILQAAYDFITKLNPADQVAIVQFKAKPMILANFSSDRETLFISLKHLGDSVVETNDITYASGQGSAIYDSLLFATKLLNKVEGRKAVLLFSDWMDTNSITSFELAKSRLEESNASLYVMKLENEPEAEVAIHKGSGFTTRQFQKYLKNYLCKDCIEAGDKRITYTCNDCLDSMNELSVEKLCQINHALYKLAQQEINLLIERVGGRVFSVHTMADLTSQYEALLAEMHTLYSIGYYPEHANAQVKWHSLEVKTKLANVVLSYRKGY